jgi:hypothetical protein
VQQIPKEVSTYEYTILANEHGSTGTGDKAEKYFSEAATRATSPSDKSQTLRMLAALHFSPGPRQNFEKGRQTFEKANDALKAQSDAYAIFEKAFTYESWATVELQNGFSENAKKRTEDARREYSSLPASFARRQRLQGLEDRIKSGASMLDLEPDAFRPASVSMERAPAEVRRVVTSLSQEDAWWIIEHDMGTLTGDDKDDRAMCERLAQLGLVEFMSDAELRRVNRKEKASWTFGVAATQLYGETRESLRSSLDEVLATARGPAFKR